MVSGKTNNILKQKQNGYRNIKLARLCTISIEIPKMFEELIKKLKTKIKFNNIYTNVSIKSSLL